MASIEIDRHPAEAAQVLRDLDVLSGRHRTAPLRYDDDLAATVWGNPLAELAVVAYLEASSGPFPDDLLESIETVEDLVHYHLQQRCRQAPCSRCRAPEPGR